MMSIETDFIKSDGEVIKPAVIEWVYFIDQPITPNDKFFYSDFTVDEWTQSV